MMTPSPRLVRCDVIKGIDPSSAATAPDRRWSFVPIKGERFVTEKTGNVLGAAVKIQKQPTGRGARGAAEAAYREHLAAVAPSGWQGPLINELSPPRQHRTGKRPHICVSLRSDTASQPGCQPPSPRERPDVPRFPFAAWGPPNRRCDIVCL